MDRTQRLSLLAAIMGSFVVGLDSTVVNVALPAIEKDLGGGLAGQQWISNGYLLALASLILVGGSLGDVFGERRIFSIGLLGFGATSMVCALAQSIEVVVAGRVAQGVFGALLAPSALAVIVAAFPPAQRGQAVGSWTAWAGIATVVGPLVGGQLIDSASWRWIFAINAPFVVATLVIVFMAVPQRPRLGARPPVDWPGAVLSFLGLAGPTLALIRQPASGWGGMDVYLPGLAGLVFLAVFLAREATTAHPMLPLELFKRRNFTAGNVETFAMYAGLSVLFFYLVLFLQQVAGYSALEAGMATLPTTAVMFVLSKRAGALADRYGPRLFMGGGPLVACSGLLLMLRVGADADYATELLPALLVFSIGLSATVAPLTATVLADADEGHAGIASGINNAIARAAGLLGVAAIGAVIAALFAGSLHDRIDTAGLSPAGRSVVRVAQERALARADVSSLAPQEGARVAAAIEAASVSAFHTGMAISATLVGLGGILGIALVRSPRRRVNSADCAGGQLVAAPADAARERGAVPVPA
ncbi:MAG: DHA2 family efflux MFS transporter permease subunit [Solirubrobacteraceae bacterium]